MYDQDKSAWLDWVWFGIVVILLALLLIAALGGQG